MKKVEFTIKTITPTLMGGGFGQNDGIRPSEIKGMMRYWFRAVAGSVIGDNLEALKKLENQIFGSQERKSPFRIVIEEKDIKYFDSNSPELTFDRMNGLVYLGIGNVIFKYDKNFKGFKFNDEKISIIAPNSEFKVKFLFRNSIKEEIIELVIYSFYLATALGGFGLRARRGFGSWQIKSKKNNLNCYDIRFIKKVVCISKDLVKDLCKNLNIKTHKNINKNTKLNFTNFIDYRLEQISTNIEDWKDLLSDLGAYYRFFRLLPDTLELKKDDFDLYWKDEQGKKIKKHTKDYDEILDRNRKIKELYNPIFGLNINYKNKYFVNLISNNETLRRASPMFISVKEINNKLALNLFVSISQHFKDKKQKIAIKEGNRTLSVKVFVRNIQDFKTVVDFIKKLNTAMGEDNANQSN